MSLFEFELYERLHNKTVLFGSLRYVLSVYNWQKVPSVPFPHKNIEKDVHDSLELISYLESTSPTVPRKAQTVQLTIVEIL